MWKLRSLLWLLAFASAALPVLAQQPDKTEKKPAADDKKGAATLPEGARLRLGSGGFFIEGNAPAAALSADGKLLVLATNQNTFRIIDAKTGKEINTIANAGGPNGIAYPPQIAFAPDNKTFAYSVIRGAAIADAMTGQIVQRVELKDQPNFFRGMNIAFSGDGKYFAIGTDQQGANQKHKANVWEVATGKQVATVDALQNGGVFTALSRDGKVLATWGRHYVRVAGDNMESSRIVQFWDVAGGKELRQVKLTMANFNQLHQAAFSPDGKTLAVAFGFSTYALIDVDSGKELRRFAGRRGLAHVLQFSPDGKTLAAGAVDGIVQAWNVDTGKRLDAVQGPKSRILNFAFPGDGKLIALGMAGQNPVWWDILSGEGTTPVAPGHRTNLLALGFSPDGKTLTSVSSDGKVFRWDPTTGKVVGQSALVDDETLRAMGGNARTYNTLSLSADGRYAATNSIYGGNGMRLWDLKSGHVVCDFESSAQNNIMGMTFSPRGDKVVTSGNMKSIQVWDVTTGQEVKRLDTQLQGNQQFTGVMPRVAFSPDEKLVGIGLTTFDPNTGQQNSRLMLLDAATGKELHTIAGPPNYSAIQVAFSPDSKLVAVNGQGRNLMVFKAASGKEYKRLDGGNYNGPVQGFMSTVAFSPDSRTVATAANGQQVFGPNGVVRTEPATIQLWELATGKVRAQYRGHSGAITCLAFAPDGKTLASAGADTAIMLWDTDGLAGKTFAALADKELDEAWGSLDKPDAQAAFKNMTRMIASSKETLFYLKGKLHPAKAPGIDPKKIEEMVTDLDSEVFETRDAAFRELERLGPLAEAALKKAHAGMVSLEMRRRIDDLLGKLDRGTLSADELRSTRAVEVLERIGSPEARGLLATLADGAPTAQITQEAQRALKRLH